LRVRSLFTIEYRHRRQRDRSGVTPADTEETISGIGAFYRIVEHFSAFVSHRWRPKGTLPTHEAWQGALAGMSSFVFDEPGLDRCAEKRDDAEFTAAALNNAATDVIVFSNGECLVEGPDTLKLRYLSAVELPALGIAPWPPVFLGIAAGRALFAIEIDSADREGIERACFVEIWRNASRLPAQEASIFAYAKAMIEWHVRHRHCGRSGVRNAVARGGHQLVGPDGNAQFPRVDPAVIVLAHRDDMCLLGRKAGWPEDWYTTLAGFVEPGETLEAAVRREVKEETNVGLAAIEYVASQPWPFPTSLMVGFEAVAEEGPIVLNDEELADAAWFTREDLATHKVRLPPRMSIAFHLIERWFDQVEGRGLRELTADKRWS
jgi:NAD+ diphosphatase